MCQRFDVVFVFDGGSDLYGGVVSRVSASTIGYADKVRIQVGKCIQRIVDGLDGACLFRRENLERKDDFLLFKQSVQFHCIGPFLFYYTVCSTNLESKTIYYIIVKKQGDVK